MSKATRRDEAIKALVALGYGNTKDEVIEYLIARTIDDLLRAGVISANRS